MDDRTERPTRKKKKKKRSNLGLLIPFFLILAGIAAYFAWKHDDVSLETLVSKGQDVLNLKKDGSPETTGKFITQGDEKKSVVTQPPNIDLSEQDNSSKRTGSQNKDKSSTDSLSSENATTIELANSQGNPTGAATSQRTSLPSDLSKFGEVKMTEEVSSAMCLRSTEIIKDFYTHLDQQRYMESYGLKNGSEDHFNQLIQKLLDNPPIVSGEMNDLFSILQNTAHFFRVIGKDNILVLKGILDREKDSFEDVLSHFYASIHNPACLKSNFSLSINEDPLYDYAGFFLNTMGGRLYLFRRDSMSRMVVSFYAILLIDLANTNGSNKHGIEIRGPIDQLIAEIETTSNVLSLRENYLDTLYSLKEKYQ